VTEDEAHDFALLQLELLEAKATIEAQALMNDMLAQECTESWQAAEDARVEAQNATGRPFVASPPSDR